MHDDIDLLAELPPLRDDEPSSLRQDILDELADHLACAYRRELLLTADDQAARSRVLARFGDPVRIAYQLWFQAMWSRIMSQRIVLACSAIMAAASIAAVLFIGSMFQQQQRMAAEQQHALMNALMSLTAKLQEQSAMQAAARSDAGPIRDLVPLKVKLVTAEDPTQPFVGATVNITPDPMKTGDASPSENTDAEGFADFAYVSIGRYRYNISLPWGETAMAKFTVHPAAEHVEVILVPSQPREAGSVTLTSAVPEELSSTGVAIAGNLVLLPRKAGELEWSSNGWVWDAYRDTQQALPANLVSVVLFPDGDVWAATQRQGGVTGFFGSGGGMGGGGMMGGGGATQGGGFFSIPAETLTHQLTSTMFSQFAVGMGGGDGSMTPPTWVKAENLKLQSGQYLLTWLSLARVEQPLVSDADRQAFCLNLSSQSPSMNVSHSEMFIVRADSLTPLTLSPPQNIVNIVRDALATLGLNRESGPPGMYPAAGPASSEPDPTKLRVQLTGAFDQHALREFALYNEGGNLIVGNEWNWHNRQAYMKRELEVGRYLLRLDLSDGQFGETRVSIRDAQQPHIEVPLPPTLKTFPIEIHGPVDPKVNPNYVIRPVVTVNRQPQVLGETTWTFPKFRPTSVYTSPGTGLVEEIETRQGPRERHRTRFTTEDRAEERFLPLPNGEYELSWDFVLIFPEPNKAGVMLSLPISGMEKIEMPKQTVTVDADHTTWDLKVPDDLWPKLHARARMFAGTESPEPPAGEDAQAKVPLRIKAVPAGAHGGNFVTKVALSNSEIPENTFGYSIRKNESDPSNIFDFKLIQPRPYQIRVEDRRNRGFVSLLDVSQPVPDPLVLEYPVVREGHGWLYLHSQPLPPAFQAVGYVLSAELESAPLTVGEREWWPAELSQISVSFDPVTGAPTAVNHTFTDLSRSNPVSRSLNAPEGEAAIPPDARRWVQLPAGTYRLTEMRLLRRQDKVADGWVMDPSAEVGITRSRQATKPTGLLIDQRKHIEIAAADIHEEQFTLDPTLLSRAILQSPFGVRESLMRDFMTTFSRNKPVSALVPQNLLQE